LFEQYQDRLTAYTAQEESALQEAQEKRNALPVFQRMMASKGAENTYQENICKVDKGITSVDKVIDGLMERIEKIPISRSEQKEMLRSLREYKKELALLKREANEIMRQTRIKSRQDMAKWTGINRGTLGTLARVQRSSIRHQKESRLAPMENSKTSIERELIEADRKIAWIERFTGKDTEIEVSVIRCAYCGRRVVPGELCPGCGSDRTTNEL
jgi:hypothetical protein